MTGDTSSLKFHRAHVRISFPSRPSFVLDESASCGRTEDSSNGPKLSNFLNDWEWFPPSLSPRYGAFDKSTSHSTSALVGSRDTSLMSCKKPQSLNRYGGVCGN